MGMDTLDQNRNRLPRTSLTLLEAIEIAHETDVQAEYSVGDVQFNIRKGHWGTALAFQGTQSCADVLDNFQIWKEDWYSYRVHSGFAEQAREVEKRVSEIDYDILIGHSLGGAIAQLLAVKDKKLAVTFGAPRVGNRAFAKAVRPYHIRVHSRGDRVSYLPPWWLGYCHGDFKFVKVGKSRTAGWNFWKFWEIKDHDTDDYLQGIREYVYR